MTDNILHIGDQTYDLNHQTPMMVQYLQMKAKYPNALLLYRMGDFYELFFEDAKRAAKLLDITLTRRGNDKAGQNIPMAGVPFHAADSYMARMIAKGQTVVICEQMEENTTNGKPAKGIMKREVVRTLTAGTITEDELISASHASSQTPSVVAVDFKIHKNKEQYLVGVSSLDISAGKIICQTIHSDNATDLTNELATVLARFEPSECLIKEALNKQQDELILGDTPVYLWLQQTLNCPIIEVASSDFSETHAPDTICQQFGVRHLDGLGIATDPLAQTTTAALIHYAKQTQQRNVPHINQLLLENTQDYLIVDDTSQRNLEIFNSVSPNGTALTTVLNHCQTSMGRRLLPQQLKRPLRNREHIKLRADAIECLLNAKPKGQLNKIQATLANVADIERISSRISLNTAKPRDLRRLADSIRQVAVLENQLAEMGTTHNGTGLLPMLLSQLPTAKPILTDIADLLEQAIIDEPPAHIRDGGMIKTGFDDELDRLTHLHDNVQDTLDKMAQELTQTHHLPSLKVGFNKVSGFYFELPKGQADSAPTTFIRRQTLKNSERYITDELKKLETDYLNAQSQALAREKQLYNQLLGDLASKVGEMQQLAQAVAQFDVLINWALLAKEYNWQRPTMSTKAGVLDIKQGRHLVVEAGLIAKQQTGTSSTSPHIASTFVANDSIMGTADTPEHLLLITGPNMGGKSTYMRQVALIVLLASCGSFVPAKSATIGDIDRIFTRIGSADDLAGGKSTFMVEMIETAHILNLATNKALVLMDEVGRGTSTTDGLAMAHACVNKLADIGCLTLFATHYFELTKLADVHDGMHNVHVAASEIEGKLLLLHQIRDGSANSSFGLHVAKMAGVPADVLKHANHYLENALVNPSISDNIIQVDNTKIKQSHSNTNTPQADLFDIQSVNNNSKELDQLNTLTAHINNINPDEMTAKQALDWVYELHKKFK